MLSDIDTSLNFFVKSVLLFVQTLRDNLHLLKYSKKVLIRVRE